MAEFDVHMYRAEKQDMRYLRQCQGRNQREAGVGAVPCKKSLPPTGFGAVYKNNF